MPKHITKKITQLFLSPLKFALLLLRWLVYLLSGLNKRDQNLWVFCDHRRIFADNNKYMFLLSSKNIKKAWITRSKEIKKHITSLGYRCYHPWNIKGIYTCLKTGIFFYDSHIMKEIFFYSKGAKLFNLWHGMPIKKIEADIEYGDFYKRYHNKFWRKLYHLIKPHTIHIANYMIATNNRQKKILKNAFMAKDTDFFICEQPKTRILNYSKSETLKFLEIIKDYSTINYIKKMSEYNKVYVYCPTFRDSYNFDYLSAINISKLKEKLSGNNDLCIIKPHSGILHSATKKDDNNILWLNCETDIYPILRFADALISDYSSIIIDFLYLEKPIFFLVPDLDKYLKFCRKMYYDFKSEIVCGPIISELPEIYQYSLTNEAYEHKRNKLKEIFMTNNKKTDLLKWDGKTIQEM